MKKTFYLILALSTPLSLFAQKKFNIDSLHRVAALTEFYEPVPPIVTPGNTPQAPPSDAIILYNGKDLSAWNADDVNKPINWKNENGILTVDNSHGYGGINTKQKFTDYQLHIEWRIPEGVVGEGQTRGNSGVNLAAYSIVPFGNIYFERGYEIQVLDNYNSKTYVNGQAGSLYKQSAPLANACKKPGEWQTYDIIWKAPRFNSDGTLKTAAYVTVIQNGVLVQNNTEVKGQTIYTGQPTYEQHGASPIRLQSHGDPGPTVSFRNIWLRQL